jgi:8-oxo-dGTP diphosphatase
VPPFRCTGRPDVTGEEVAEPLDRRVLDPHPEMDRATLCHPVRDGEMLLMDKKRGVGAGNVVAPGGKIESGERPREAARREVREEVGIEVHDLGKVAELSFTFGAEPFMFVHVYLTESFSGTPTESPEGDPAWYDLEDLPYDRMWDDDRHWLPPVVAGEAVAGEFRFDADGDALLDWDLERGVEF